MNENDLMELFDNIVERFEENVAIRTVDTEITYGQLKRRVDAVVDGIMGKLDTDEPFNISLLFEHNEKMIIGILGSLKAQKAYVSLNSLDPVERLKTIIKDSGSKIIMTDNKNLTLAYKLVYLSDSKVSIINVDELKEDELKNEVNIRKGRDAYILYTSGSTGKPKGVVQNVLTVKTFVNYFINEIDIKENDNILLTTPYTHTVSVIDIFSSLLSGATLSVYDVRNNLNIEHFINWVKDVKITIIHTVPVFYRYFISKIKDKSFLDNIRLLILGGEDVSRNDFEIYKDYFRDSTYFINLYGLSEVLIGTINVLSKESEIEREAISIGYPVEILNASVLNEENNEAKPFEIGELVFESEYLNARYHNLPEKTKELYETINDREYLRTGDLVKRLPDEDLEYIGRKDFQFKIQGNRVNPREIEVLLNEFDEVTKSIVIPEDNDRGEKYIIAYYTTKSQTVIPKENLYNLLRDKLPDYMLPSTFINIESFPLTESGKIDRKKLPKISQENKEVVSDEIIKSMCRVWESIFKLEKVEMFDNFFRLGGNSLLAGEMINMIQAKFDIKLSINTIFENQTAYELSNVVKKNKGLLV